MQEKINDEYESFCKCHFPQSDFTKEMVGIYRLVCSNNALMDIFIKYIDKNTEYLNYDKMIFLKRYVEGINKILLYLPLNDGIGICACMRYGIEQILKFIYAIFFDENISKINKTNYRHIKDDIKRNLHINNEIKCEISKLYTYYSNYSNDIHDRSLNSGEEIIFLKEIICGKNDYSNNIISDLDNIFIIVCTIIIKIFKLQYDYLGSAERLRIKHVLTKSKEKKVTNLLKTEMIS